MIDIRKFDSLGHADHGWLDARHHFSFADYYDPARMGWGAIRVWNDDKIAAKTGFPPHPHRDMEIVTYVRTGAITHQDSMGNKGRTGAGDVQVMSAGRGVTHAEYNLEDEATTLFQIWIETDKPAAEPAWGAMPFPKDSREGKFQLLASGDAGDGVAHRQRRCQGARRDDQGRRQHRARRRSDAPSLSRAERAGDGERRCGGSARRCRDQRGRARRNPCRGR